VAPLDEDDQLERRGAARPHGQRLLEERRLGDEHAAAGVAHDVLSLLDGEGRVDGERGRPDPRRGRVGDVELRPVGQPQGDGVAATHPHAVQAGGDGVDTVGVVAPGRLRRRRCAAQARTHGRRRSR
jgi:hypothetical protein